MSSRSHACLCALFAAVISSWLPSSEARANVFSLPAGQTSLSLVPVGNAGNANDLKTGFGRVVSNYSISKFETTIGQYVQFLNAVAKADTYSLYNPSLASNANIAGISRTGEPGSYSYDVIGSPNKPVTYVSWGDAVRFANWLTNGQPTGDQGIGTTETGSYTLAGAVSDASLLTVTRNPDARYVIPTENEWYKAAYYDPTKDGGNYWLFPMKTDTAAHSAPPPGTLAPDAARAGNFYQTDGIANAYNEGYAVTSSMTFSATQDYLTNAGAYTLAASYYGTFDQGGNVWEWNEALVSSSYRGLRGASWGSMAGPASSTRSIDFPSDETATMGFRIVEVPEPTMICLLAFGFLAFPARRRR